MTAPLFAMVCLTFAVMLLTLVQRIRAVRRGDVSPKYFKLVQGEAPEYMLKPARHFSNLFETPVLFYAAGVLAIVTYRETPLMLGVAWVYVITRLAHALIHLTYNHVIHRLLAFMLSCICIFIMWLLLILPQ
jgi:hypothetical protein